MNRPPGFAIWLTGLPASGKSTIARALVEQLSEVGTAVIVLESDIMRRILMPAAAYGPADRDRFYSMLVQLGSLITGQGGNVIFDATANRRAYRDEARSRIQDFMEIHVQCTVAECMKRDPKGIYRKASAGDAAFVPGVQVPYEAPERPELTLQGSASPEANAALIVAALKHRFPV